MMHISVVSVPVSDQERAKTFYRDVCGFSIVREADAGPGRRWIMMKPPSGAVGISLVNWSEAMPPGCLQGIVMDTSDIERAHEKLKAAGLAISPVQEAGWGRFATFSDPDGNGWILATSYHR